MSHFEFNVRDYRIIKEADFSPEGITLIYAKNGSGKSTIIKSLVSLLSNKHSEDNFRHGKNSYSITARVGDNKVSYTRDGAVSRLQYNDETSRSKLGMDPLNKVEPRFPLKRIDFVDERFFPNFSFQNSVPVFEDISVENLFSAMFSDMARLSERVTGCRNDCVNTAKVKNDSQVNSDMLKEKVSAASKDLAKLRADNPDIDSKYEYLKGLNKKREDQIKFQAEFSEISSLCSDENKRLLVGLCKEAQPLFSDLVFMQNMRGVLTQLDRVRVDLGGVQTQQAELSALFPVDVYNLVSGVKQVSTVQASLTSVHQELDAMPDVSLGLVSSGVTLISLKKTLEGVELQLQELPVVSDSLISEVYDLIQAYSEWDRVQDELKEVNDSYEYVMQELKEFPCTRYLDGLCPFQEQLRIGG